MKVTKISSLSGKENTMDLPITQEQIQEWESGELVQHVFPELSPEEREFLMTGITDEEWDRAFNLEEDSEF